MTAPLDLGDDHILRFADWHPDRKLNPQFAHLPNVDRYSAIVEHLAKDGSPCEGAITFAGPVQEQLEPNKPCWIVESWDPLTVSPSLLCPICGDHGFIRGGKWVKA